MARSSSPALNVRWHTGDLVGQVVVPGVTEFGYVPDWLRAGFSLSPLVVPFTDILCRSRDTNFDQLPGFLSDCLPDQWGRRLMTQEFSAAGINQTPVKMLAWVGRRGIGALSFEPVLETPVPAGSWEPVRPLLLAREAQAVQRLEAPAAFRHLAGAGTAGGAFPKATVALLADGSVLCGGHVAGSLPAGHGARLGLLKLDSEDLPGRASTDGRMEFAYMEMARAAGIKVARCEVLTEDEGERPRHHLFVERFDVVANSSRRLHLLTLAGALQESGLTYRHLLDATRRLTQDRAEVVEAVRRMIFNVRAANADDHGKNHSFCFDDSTRSWSLSPAYDLTLNCSEQRQFFGLTPNTFGVRPRMNALRDVAADAGVQAAEFEQLDREVKGAITRWPEFARQADLTPEDAQRAALLQAAMADALSMDLPQRRSRW